MSENTASQISEWPPTVSDTEREAWRLAQDQREEKAPLTERSRKDYLKKGIPRPQDGARVKQDRKESCLTCIHLGKVCHGTEVEEGRCRQCRGDSGDTKTKRGCYWLDPGNNVFTFADAVEVADARKNSHNTKEGREARKKRKEAATESLRPPQIIEDLIEWPIAVHLLQEAASELDFVGYESDETIIVALFNAVASRNFAQGDVDGLLERQPSAIAQQVILQTLRRMKLSGKGLSVEDIQALATQGNIRPLDSR